MKRIIATTIILLALLTTQVKAQKNSSSQGFNFITPSNGMSTIPVWMTDSTVTINWSGGGSGTVGILLIDMHLWAVYKSIVSKTPNNGSYKWKIPLSIPSGMYELYIYDNSPSSAYLYSPGFVITKKNYLSIDKMKRMKTNRH